MLYKLLLGFLLPGHVEFLLWKAEPAAEAMSKPLLRLWGFCWTFAAFGGGGKGGRGGGKVVRAFAVQQDKRLRANLSRARVIVRSDAVVPKIASNLRALTEAEGCGRSMGHKAFIVIRSDRPDWKPTLIPLAKPLSRHPHVLVSFAVACISCKAIRVPQTPKPVPKIHASPRAAPPTKHRTDMQDMQDQAGRRRHPAVRRSSH